jgi:hypothetical protein
MKFMIAVLTCLSCLSAPALADTDQWGVEYPAACSKEAVAQFKPTVIRVTQAFLDKATNAKNRTGTVMPSGAIAIRDDLTGARQEDTLRHEICHLIAGDFHD